MQLLYKIFVFLSLILLLTDYSPVYGSSDNDQFVVVLDAGHGGRDTGARGKKSLEKDIVLDITLRVGKYLNEYLPKIKVVYTRKDDRFIDLFRRPEIANEHNADLFVSIHANSSPSSRPYGTETFVMGLHKSESNLKVAQKENAVITLEENYMEKYEGYDPSSAESYIIFSLMQNTFLDQSLRAAEHVQNEFRDRARRKDRGVKQAGFLVLWKTTMPSILIETGFISNSTEERYLLSENGRDYLASAIFRAIRSYYEDINATQLEISRQQDSIKEVIKQNNEALANSRVFFSVQLTASSKEANLDEKPFIHLKQGIWENKKNGLYKYYFQKTSSYDEAKSWIEECKNYFPDAFIVAFENEEQISVHDALQKLN
jgi:N-acetylmuramoyl-L-alanine amidase